MDVLLGEHTKLGVVAAVRLDDVGRRPDREEPVHFLAKVHRVKALREVDGHLVVVVR